MSRPEDIAGFSLALLRSARSKSDGFRAALERHGLRVVLDVKLAGIANGLHWSHQQADVVLLDLEHASDAEFDLLDQMLDHLTLPVVVHDGPILIEDTAWMQRVIDKMRCAIRAHRDSAATQHDPVRSHHPDLLPTSLRCWVLGASFGGPEALKRFFNAMPQPPAETAFIIGQHIGDGFVEVLAAQLNRGSLFKVQPAAEGALLESGQVYLAPVRERLRIDASGRLRLQPDSEQHSCLPSIDHLMEEVARRFGPHSGGIVFSGMGDDGARGSVALLRAGGVVWAQDAASSACDSMPNCSRATGAVSREGSPETLAAELYEHLTSTAPATGIQTA